MVDVKQIIIKPIASKIANDFVKKHHYSGKIVNNSTLHLGAFYDNILHGVMSFGSSLDKRKMLGLVKGTLWNEFLELNRMAFDDFLPKNSESRSLSIAFKIVKKQYPHIKWIISFADGTQCGDGTIYRASGFVLTKIKSSEYDLWELPESLHYLNSGNPTVHRMTIQCKTSIISHWCLSKYNTHNVPLQRLQKENGGKLQSGVQLRYIYFLHPNEKQNLTVPILPFSKIDEMNAGMYKGQKRKIKCVESSKSEQAISNSKVAENYRPQRSIIIKPKIKKLATNK